MFIILLTSSDVNLSLISRMSCSRQPAPNRHWQRYPACSPCPTSPCRPYRWPTVGASGGWLTICLCPTSPRTLPMPTVTLSPTPTLTNQVHEILNLKKKKNYQKIHIFLHFNEMILSFRFGVISQSFTIVWTTPGGSTTVLPHRSGVKVILYVARVQLLFYKQKTFFSLTNRLKNCIKFKLVFDRFIKSSRNAEVHLEMQRLFWKVFHSIYLTSL